MRSSGGGATEVDQSIDKTGGVVAPNRQRQRPYEYPSLTPVGPPPRGRGPNRRPRKRWLLVVQVLATMSVIVLVLAAISLIGALRTPGNADFKAKWADWLRSPPRQLHRQPARALVLLRPPGAAPRAGSQRGLNPIPSRRAAGDRHPRRRPSGWRPRRRFRSSSRRRWPARGSGSRPARSSVASPGMYIAQYRADTTYTSQITTAVWIDPHRLRVRLMPGAQEPGGTWADAAVPRAAPPPPTRWRRSTAGSASRMPRAASTSTASRGPPPGGAASVVIDSTGTIDIGTWGTR